MNHHFFTVHALLSIHSCVEYLSDAECIEYYDILHALKDFLACHDLPFYPMFTVCTTDDYGAFLMRCNYYENHAQTMRCFNEYLNH